MVLGLGAGVGVGLGVFGLFAVAGGVLGGVVAGAGLVVTGAG